MAGLCLANALVVNILCIARGVKSGPAVTQKLAMIFFKEVFFQMCVQQIALSNGTIFSDFE